MGLETRGKYVLDLAENGLKKNEVNQSRARINDEMCRHTTAFFLV